jgi:hypothetical protein
LVDRLDQVADAVPLRLERERVDVEGHEVVRSVDDVPREPDVIRA